VLTFGYSMVSYVLFEPCALSVASFHKWKHNSHRYLAAE
jgi:hypothetical protein